jgi:hypothetical protein
MNLAKAMLAVGVNLYCKGVRCYYIKRCFIKGRHFGKGKVFVSKGGEEGMCGGCLTRRGMKRRPSTVGSSIGRR